MYKYFALDEPDDDRIGCLRVSDRGSSVRSSVHSWGDIVPLYNEEGESHLMFMAIFPITYSGTIGEITGYMFKPKKQLDGPVPQPPSVGTSISDIISLNVRSGHILDARGMEGQVTCRRTNLSFAMCAIPRSSKNYSRVGA